MRKCYKWLIPVFLLISLVCVVFGMVTNAKYVHEDEGSSLTVTVDYQVNYLAPNNYIPMYSGATKLVFTTLKDCPVDVNSLTYPSVGTTSGKKMGWNGSKTTDSIWCGLDASTSTAYIISRSNRPIVPYKCATQFYCFSNVTEIDFGGTVTVGTDENGNDIEVPLFDTSSVTDMSSMFNGHANLTTLDISSFNTSKVTNMYSMFTNCRALKTLNLSNIDTSSVTNMGSMFSGCNSLESLDLSPLNTSNVENMSYMFFGIAKNESSPMRTLDVSMLDTSKVTNMDSMFQENNYLQTLIMRSDEHSAFTTESATKLNSMFAFNQTLTSLDVSFFNTSRAENMSQMFYECFSLASLDLSNFDTSNVTDMTNMFNECTSLTSLDVSSFDTSKVTTMNGMFNKCSNLTELDLSSFVTSASTNVTTMFDSCTKLKSIYAAGDWTVGTSTSMFQSCTAPLTGGAGTTYTSEHMDGTYAVIDKGTEKPGYFTGVSLNATAFHSLADDIKNITFGKTENHTNDIANVTPEPLGSAGSSSSYAISGYTVGDTLYVLSEYTPIIAPVDSTRLIGNPIDGRVVTFEREDLADDTSLAWFDTSLVTNMTAMFSEGVIATNYNRLTINGLDTFDTSKVTNMSSMFKCDNNLQPIDVSSFDTSSVTDMSYMFYNCQALTDIDLSEWNVSDVKNMYGMFTGCKFTQLDLSAWDTSNVSDMRYMFWACNLTSLNVSNWNTSKVTKMEGLFYQCKALTELNLSGWNTSKVNNMRYMFRGCNSLKTIYVGDGWTAENVSDSTGMFRDCSNLVGGAGTTFNSNNVDRGYAHVDGGTANPGYLTLADTLNTKLVHSLLAEHTDITSVVFGSTDAHDVTGAEAIPVSFTGNAVNCYLVGDTAYFLSAQPIKVWYDASNLFHNLTSIKSITFESVGDTAWFDTSCVTNMSSMFEAQQNGDTFESALTTIVGLDTFDTKNVTTMNKMFRHCEKLESVLDLSGWNTENVTTMEAMFDGLRTIQEIKFGSAFNTSKVTSMKHMFNECEALTKLDVSMFDTSNVTNMFAMFNRCKALPSITFGEKFDTSKVTNMGYMFCNCHALTELNLSAWDTSNVTSLSNTFSNCLSLTEVDISGWNTKNVTDMGQMFYYDVKLTSIKGLGSLDTSNVTSLWQTFDSCNVIEELDLSSWDTRKVQYMCWLFCNCRALTKIYVGDYWSTDKLVADDGGDKQMFGWCYNINANCSDENSEANNEYVNKTHAYVGDGGYLSRKDTP